MPGWLFAGSRPTFSYKAAASDFANSGSPGISFPGSIAAGDVLVFFSTSSDGTAVPPAAIPPGFTVAQDVTITATGSGGRAKRLTSSYKLANGSEAGAATYGPAADYSAIGIVVFSSDTGIFGTISHAGVHQQIARNSAPAAQTIPAAGQILPLVGFALGQRASGGGSFLSLSPSDSIISISQYTLIAFKIYNSGPSNMVASMTGGSGENGLASFFLTGDV